MSMTVLLEREFSLYVVVTELVAQLCPPLCDPMDCSTPQAPLSMRFSGQENWSGLPFSSPGDLPDPGIKTWVSCIAGRFFTIWALCNLLFMYIWFIYNIFDVLPLYMWSSTVRLFNHFPNVGHMVLSKVALLTVNTLVNVSLYFCDYRKLPEKEFSLLKSMHYSHICLGDCTSYNQINTTWEYWFSYFLVHAKFFKYSFIEV